MTMNELGDKLETILGSKNVYFQPPESVKIKYPCIIYNRDRMQNLHANNFKYIKNIAYQIILVDKNPTSPIFDKLLDLQMCRFDREYTKDNMNYWVFTLYTNYKEENNNV